MSYVTLGAAPVSAGCQLPYTAQNGMAYSRAFLERNALKSSLRSSYVPSASAQKQIDAWIAAGLDPYVPVKLSVAQSRLSCGDIAPGAFDRGMINKSTIEKMLQENNALRSSDSVLNDVAREIYSRNQFLDSDVVRLSAAIDAAKSRVVVAPVVSAPVVMIKAPEPVLNLTNELLNKTAAVNAPAIAYSAPASDRSPVVTGSYVVPARPTDRPAQAPAAITEKAPISGGKALIIGAAIALIFLLGKSGKK